MTKYGFLSLVSGFVLSAVAVLPLPAQVPPDVPAAFQATYSTMTTQITGFQQAVNQNWNGTPYPVAWAPHLSAAESDNYLTLLGANYYNNAVSTELLELRATGAKAVTVHISFPILYQPFYTYSGSPSNYQAFVSFYQQVVTGVHAAGMKLVVEATVAEALDGTEGGDFAPYYQTLDWNDYMSGRAQNAVNVAQLIKPDYLSLICEPDSEATNASQPTENSPAGALQLLQTQLTALQQANITNVSLGAGTGTWIASFTTYLQNFSATSLNYIDMHVYAVNNSDLMNVLTGASIIQQSGKAIGVSEAWTSKESNSELRTLNINTLDSRDAFSFWAPVDTAFLQAMVDCAQYDKFLFFAPSYPGYFAAYLNYTTYGADTPAQILPDAFDAAAAANRAGAFTSTGVAFSVMIAGIDTTPPATPSAPTLSSSSSTGATITWIPTTDNIGVAGYNIYRDGVVVSQLATSNFVDTGLTPGATYIYELSAFDAQGNVSPQSRTLTVTLIDLSPPTVPTGLAVAGATQNSVSLTWSPSTGGGGVAGYRLLKGTLPSTMKIVQASVAGTSYVDSTLSPQTTYYYAVESYNETGISSAPSATISTTTLALPPPTHLGATAVSASSLSLSWTASGGSDAPTSYRILKGTSPSSLAIIVANNLGITYTDSKVAKLTTYYYEVEMVDSLGRSSGPGNMVTVTTP
jgi:fibronectin type 3 domain-containing protein